MKTCNPYADTAFPVVKYNFTYLPTYHNLSLLTVSFLVSIYSLASQTRFLKEGKGLVILMILGFVTDVYRL